MNVINIKPAPSFDDLKAIWPVSRRGCLPLARNKFEALTSGEWTTLIEDRETRQRERVTYPKQNPETIIEAAKTYIQSKCLPGQTYEEMWGGHPKLEDGGKYVMHLSTWLNRGGFEQ